MITRRDFFRMTGLAAAALGAGYTTGKWIVPTAEDRFSMVGYLPADPAVAADLAAVFSRKVGFSERPVVLADEPWKGMILAGNRRAAAGLREEKRADRSVVFRIESLPRGVPADILVSDTRSGIYRPESDFTMAMAELRERLRGRTAMCVFTAESRIGRTFTSRAVEGERFAVIENEKGIFDRIPLAASFRSVSVNGPQGKTGIAFADGRVHVHTAVCRNQLCRHMEPISREGQLLACAPNKVLIRIESA